MADAVAPEVTYADLAPLLAPSSPATRVRSGVPHTTARAPLTVWDAREAADAPRP